MCSSACHLSPPGPCKSVTGHGATPAFSGFRPETPAMPIPSLAPSQKTQKPGLPAAQPTFPPSLCAARGTGIPQLPPRTPCHRGEVRGDKQKVTKHPALRGVVCSPLDHPSGEPTTGRFPELQPGWRRSPAAVHLMLPGASERRGLPAHHPVGDTDSTGTLDGAAVSLPSRANVQNLHTYRRSKQQQGQWET